MSGVEDVETSSRKHKAPYTPHHPIPTVQRYRQEKQEREGQYGHPDADGQDDRSKTNRLTDAYTALRHGKEAVNPNENTQPYKSINKNLEEVDEDNIADDHAGRVQPKSNDEKFNADDGDDTPKDTTEGSLVSQDPKKARKDMKKWSADGTEREVTDPVTHLPVTIHDYTEKDLKMTPQNGPPAGMEPRSATGASALNKSDEQLQVEQIESQDAHSGSDPLFPPPDFAMTRKGVTVAYQKAMTAGLGLVAASIVTVVALFQFTRNSTGWSRAFFLLLEVATCLGVSGAVIMGTRQWTENRINDVWETEVWQAEREKGQKLVKSNTPESTQWLNSFLASVWPLINPDLFTSISDTLEVSCPFSFRVQITDQCRILCKLVYQRWSVWYQSTTLAKAASRSAYSVCDGFQRAQRHDLLERMASSRRAATKARQQATDRFQAKAKSTTMQKAKTKTETGKMMESQRVWKPKKVILSTWKSRLRIVRRPDGSA